MTAALVLIVFAILAALIAIGALYYYADGLFGVPTLHDQENDNE